MTFFDLEFDGYWSDASRIPARSGICCVYRHTHTSLKQPYLELIHIGSFENVRDGLAKKAGLNSWLSDSRYGRDLLFAFAPVVRALRSCMQEALIYEHRPPENELHTIFPVSETMFIRTRGASGCLKSEFAIFGNEQPISTQLLPPKTLLEQARGGARTRNRNFIPAEC